MKYLFLFMALALYPLAATAHSAIQETTPLDGAVLLEAPAEIGLNFTDKLRLTAVKARHSNGETQSINLGDYKGFEAEFVFPMQPMGAGSYEVEWRGLGMDGHAMQGTFTFEVE
ncbi:copper resistance protein CopC [Roseovarius faecimaris]|uniref:Copper resistance protein CopC n=1 Tax=Roseovarius faecimaris TaxID=2494550 RepID=A0A6I6IKT9_9RHOB|nr:copper resistance CopC family protein [Roseovarius faecimaris]QGX97489.1 copper resistance protein CopC [Roseovarius faecimaris]